MRFAIVLLGLLAFQSSRAAVTITFPVVQLQAGHLFGIEFDIPSLNIGEPSTKTDFLDEVTNVTLILGYPSGSEMTELHPPKKEDGHFSWFNYLDIAWTGVRSETEISAQLIFGGSDPGHYFRSIWFENDSATLWEEVITDDPPYGKDTFSGSFDPKYITYRDPSGAIPEPWGFGLALPVLLLLKARRRKLSIASLTDEGATE